MIKIGIIGLGNVTWNVHLPILLSRNDIKISWICEINSEKKNVIEKKKIKFFNDLDDIINHEKVDIILITTPYSERIKIFDKVKTYCSGIFFEKPHALSLYEHKYFLNYLKSHAMTVGYSRRKMGIVKSMKKIINLNIFGNLRSIKIFFGDIHYRFDGFRSKVSKSGGGIFFEAGTHWLDCIFFTTNAKKILNFESKKKFESNLDIKSSGKFDLLDENNNQFPCEFNFSILENTSNKIEYNFDNCSVDLYLFEEESNLKVKNNIKDEFLVQDNEFLNYPFNSLDVGWSHWNDFLNSFKLNKESDISFNSFYLTAEITELFYEK